MWRTRTEHWYLNGSIPYPDTPPQYEGFEDYVGQLPSNAPLRFADACYPGLVPCSPRTGGVWFLSGLYRYCLSTDIGAGIDPTFFTTGHAWHMQLSGCSTDSISLVGENACPIPFRPTIRPYVSHNGVAKYVIIPSGNASLGIAIELGSIKFVAHAGCKQNYPNECP